MNEDEKRSLIERYFAAYNAFDIDGMMSVIHLVSSSKMYPVMNFRIKDDHAFIEVAYEGVLASD